VLHHRERDRPPGLGREAPHPVHLLLGRGEVLAITPAGASSKTPVPASDSARPIANSSSSAANVPGTGSPSMARWAIVREVETPSAPASMPSRTMRAICSMSSGVAGSLRAPRSPIT
jgi:hypothetical protein